MEETSIGRLQSQVIKLEQDIIKYKDKVAVAQEEAKLANNLNFFTLPLYNIFKYFY